MKYQSMAVVEDLVFQKKVAFPQGIKIPEKIYRQEHQNISIVGFYRKIQ